MTIREKKIAEVNAYLEKRALLIITASRQRALTAGAVARLLRLLSSSILTIIALKALQALKAKPTQESA